MLLWGAAAAAALWLFGRVWPVLWPMLWPFGAGSLAALLLDAPVSWAVRRGIARGAAAVLGMALALALVLLPLLGTGWIAWRELLRLQQRLPGLYGALRAALDEAGRRAGAASGRLPPAVRAFLTAELRRGYADGRPLLQRVVSLLQHGAAAVPDAAFAGLVACAAAYFALRDRERLELWLESHLSGDVVTGMRDAARAVRRAVWGMLRAQALLAAVTFVVSLVGLWGIGAPYPVLAAVVAAALDALPLVGPAALFVPWGVGCALAGLGGAALGLLLVLLAVAAARWFLTPYLLGGQVGLHPFLALAAMFLGVRLAGLAGLLLGPVAASVLQAVVAPPPPPAGPVRRGRLPRTG
jgi:sporulation integral membrane protein YtvI